MDSVLWSIAQGVGILMALAFVAWAIDLVRYHVSKHVGIGRVYRRLRKDRDLQELADNMTAIGDALQTISVAGTVRNGDWRWELGADLKRLADYSRSLAIASGNASPRFLHPEW